MDNATWGTEVAKQVSHSIVTSMISLWNSLPWKNLGFHASILGGYGGCRNRYSLLPADVGSLATGSREISSKDQLQKPTPAHQALQS